MKINTVFYLIFIVILSISGCSSAPSQTPLKIGLANSKSNLPFLIASKEGFFKKEGLNIELVTFDQESTKDCAFERHLLDGCLCSLPTAILTKEKTPDAKIILSLRGGKKKQGRVALVSKPRKNKPSLQSLKGKKIALSSDFLTQFVADRFFKNNNIESDEIQKQIIPFPDVRLQKIFNKEYDAAVLTEPAITFAKSHGCHVIIDDTEKSLSYEVVLFHDDWLVDHKELAAKIIKALNKAILEINKCPQKFYDQLIEIASEPSSDPDSLRYELLASARAPNEMNQIHVIPNFSYNSVPDSIQYNEVVLFLEEQGFIKNKPNYKDLIDASYLIPE